MTYMDLLDRMLGTMARSAQKPFTQHSFAGMVQDYTVRVSLWNYLVSRALITELHGSPIGECTISVEGAMFHQRGGFIGEYRRQQRDAIWSWVKTMATVIHALLLLVIAAWAAWMEFGNKA